jgi:hypothetical protein
MSVVPAYRHPNPVDGGTSGRRVVRCGRGKGLDQGETHKNWDTCWKDGPLLFPSPPGEGGSRLLTIYGKNPAQGVVHQGPREKVEHTTCNPMFLFCGPVLLIITPSSVAASALAGISGLFWGQHKQV